MAQKVNIVLADDIDGSEGHRDRLRSASDGTSYEIDLNVTGTPPPCATRSPPYVGHGRRWSSGPRRAHNYIGTEHILLGLIHEGEGVAPERSENASGSRSRRSASRSRRSSARARAPVGSHPHTPRAKKVLELSLREACSSATTTSAPSTSSSASSARARAWPPRCWSSSAPT